jgi:hypothetical protein
MIIAVLIVSPLYKLYTSRSCAEIASLYRNSSAKTTALYPECSSYFDGTTPDKYVAVLLNFNGRVEEVGAALAEGFILGFTLALALHAIGIEIYVSFLLQVLSSCHANAL